MTKQQNVSDNANLNTSLDTASDGQKASQLLANQLVKRGLLQLPKDYHPAPPPPPVTTDLISEQISSKEEIRPVAEEIQDKSCDLLNNGSVNVDPVHINHQLLPNKAPEKVILSKEMIGPSKPMVSTLNKGKMRFIPSSVKRKSATSTLAPNRTLIIPSKSNETDHFTGNTTNGQNTSSLIPKVTIVRKKKEENSNLDADSDLDDFLDEIGEIDDDMA